MRLLEFSDSAFPVGAFSFSNGLETASFERIVYDASTLEQYTYTAVLQNIYSDAIAALIAYRAAAAGDYELVCEADRQVILCKMNAEARQMLVRMGKKMTELAVHMVGNALMKQWLKDISTQKVYGTYPIAQSIFFQQSGLGEKELFVAMEYGVMNMILNAALRCVKVSHYETQQILYRLSSAVVPHYEMIKERTFEDMSVFCPETDILASLHEKGKMRMFMN